MEKYLNQETSLCHLQYLVLEGKLDPMLNYTTMNQKKEAAVVEEERRNEEKSKVDKTLGLHIQQVVLKRRLFCVPLQ